MKRLVALSVLALSLLLALDAFAHEGHAMHAAKGAAAKGMAANKAVTIQGEVVDSGCYLSNGERGPDHKECATKCISTGMPMGLLTAGDKFYLLTPNHMNADPYNSLKDMAAATVAVTGKVFTRNGVTMIDVTGVKDLGAKAAN